MSTRQDADDVMSLVEAFEFVPKGQKKFYKASCDEVDAEGSQAALRYEAVMRIGEQIQAWTLVSNKSLKNIYRMTVDQVIREYGFEPAHEPLLRDMLVLYWKRGAELQAALNEKPKRAVPRPLPPVDEAFHHSAVGAVIHDPDHEEVSYPDRFEPDHGFYNHSREAGPF